MSLQHAMATDITVIVAAGPSLAAHPLQLARSAVSRVEAACTRLDPAGPLTVANQTPRQWHVLSPECFAAVEEAAGAHLMTGGLFDPRILDDARILDDPGILDASCRPGMEGSSDAADAPRLATVATPNAQDQGARPAPWSPWHPDLDPETCSVRLGDRPIDLSGIDTGLALRLAAAELSVIGAPFMVEAGEDIAVGGLGPDDDGWLIGVENPAAAGTTPHTMVAALRLLDGACSTSSVGGRGRMGNTRPEHRPPACRSSARSESPLRTVTVIDQDPVRAAVWSRSLLLLDPEGVAEACRTHDLGALWVDTNGAVEVSALMRPNIVWQLGGD